MLSGILEEQTESLLARYERWFSLDKPATEDGWVRLSGSAERDNRRLIH